MKLSFKNDSIYIAVKNKTTKIVQDLFVQNPFDQLLRNWLRLILQEALLYKDTYFHNLQVPITTSQKFRSESTYTEEKFVVDINL